MKLKRIDEDRRDWNATTRHRSIIFLSILMFLIMSDVRGQELPGGVAGQVFTTADSLKISWIPLRDAVVAVGLTPDDSIHVEEEAPRLVVSHGYMSPPLQIMSPGATLKIVSRSSTPVRLIALKEDLSRAFSMALPLPSLELEKRITDSGILSLIDVAFDPDSILAMIIVSPHAGWSRTDTAGVYLISGVPPGCRPLTCYHSQLGTTVDSVCIRPAHAAQRDLYLPGFDPIMGESSPPHQESKIKPLIQDPAHFVGIGGSGVSALAEYLTDSGLCITGCDSLPSQRIETLKSSRIPVWIGHHPEEHLRDTRTVVHTAAVPRHHPELSYARQRGLKVLPRSLLLARISRMRDSICVAGSHGKSTVAALTAHILSAAGLDPGYILGAVFADTNRGGYLGSGRYTVMETDEYDRTLERVCPAIAVITNVEAEHLDVYGDFEKLVAAFSRFARRGFSRTGTIIWEDVPLDYGSNSDNSFIRCGTSLDCVCRGEILQSNPTSMEIAVSLFNTKSFRTIFPMTGPHSLANAIMASAASFVAGVDAAGIADALSSFPV